MDVPSYAYLSTLLVSLGGLAWLDHQRGLALFVQTRRTLVTLAACVAIFLAWDALGIALGVFATNQAYVVGINLGTPDLPIEEVLLLTLICYVTLLLYRLRDIRS